MASSFSDKLYEWHLEVERDLPWKENKDPFFIWLSEIILQQTRVEQGKPYFLKFKSRFANVEQLAAVSDEELMKLWEGLGYYSRARNLHKAAKQIVSNGGEFPGNYAELLELPGVGPYTAAAIASFAYDEPVPVIDGNVMRVISRIFGVYDGIDTKEGRQKITNYVDQVFDEQAPAKYNQAIMDFGALHCTPKKPLCLFCPFRETCVAYKENTVKELPFKAKRVAKLDRTIRYALINYKNQILLKKRVDSGIWRHLHDFVEIDQNADKLPELLQHIEYKEQKVDGPYKHVLTHRNLSIYFHIIEAQELEIAKGSPYFLVDRKNLRKFAFPKIIDWYLNEKSIS